ncbi:MAG: 16S rRNA (cytidine(1402)-2'-O)-methyltransferase [Candidatus Tenebribacter burtonii]|jgi:16S rRNA (cytidine1402-2'-O)-methyltransferase|nr:16S rRNA (cytidine(1402)-2'-O)-methyltransferase [Candidatus Tenebribacter burtonii]
MSSKNKLYVVATHIGNPDDITLRALKVLKKVDFVICEEFKIGSRLLKGYDIKKPLELLNEHNEVEQTQIILDRLVMNGETAAIISDAGTPLFADPGNNLVWYCHQNGLDVVPLPGASSIMAALMVSGLKLEQFLYYGFLPANKDERKRAIKRLPNNYDLVFLETPYRLKQLLADMKKILGENRQAIIAYKLTQPTESIFWGNLQELTTMTHDLPKGEFVFILRKIEVNKGRKYAR